MLAAANALALTAPSADVRTAGGPKGRPPTIYKGWGEVAQRCLGDVTVAINAQTLGDLTK